MASGLVEDERLDDGTTDLSAHEARSSAVGDTIYRVRDLEGRGRWIACVFVAALLVAPLLALARYLGDWVPSGDPALMGLRALDVGTSRTPLVGQPSSSASYVEDNMVHHLGPSHLYLLAPAIRLMGAATGMLVVSVMITGGSVVVAAWAVFRQLGPTGGAVAVAVLGTTTFTTGASSLANPVSSSISGYPLLCSAVLLWCLLCGDLRLLPLATLWVSFTAQQHLSVLPALVVMTAVGVAGCVVRERRQRRLLALWGAIAGAVALVVWSPVLIQEAFGGKGNLSQLREYAGHSNRPKLGVRVAFDQVVHTLGLPPLLGPHDLDGHWFFGTPSAFTASTAMFTTALLVGAGLRWERAADRRRVALVAMAGVAALAGLVNGSSVPRGIEQFRLPFYHWSFVLTFFTTTAIALLVGDLLALHLARRHLAGPWMRPAVLPALAVAAVVLPSAVNPTLNRFTNTLSAAYAPEKRQVIDELGDAVMDQRNRLEGPVVLLARGESVFSGLSYALALNLATRGLNITYPASTTNFVHPDHLAHKATVQAGLVLVVDEAYARDQAATNAVPGELLIDIDNRSAFDWEAFDALVAHAEATDTVVLGPQAEQVIEDQESEQGRALMRKFFNSFVGDTARQHLNNRDNLQRLLETPLQQPSFDPNLLRRVRDTLPDDQQDPDDPRRRLRVYLLDRPDLLDWAAGSQITD